MRSSLRLLVAASVTVAGLCVAGCSLPERDAPGGILTGNELTESQASRGVVMDRTSTAAEGARTINTTSDNSDSATHFGTTTPSSPTIHAATQPAVGNAMQPAAPAGQTPPPPPPPPVVTPSGSGQ